MSHNGIAAALQKALKNLTIATVVLYLILASVIYLAWVESTNQRESIQRVADNATTALCTLRGDLERRVADSVQFLVKHPEGIPGISVADIKQSIRNQQATIEALEGLNCREET